MVLNSTANPEQSLKSAAHAAELPTNKGPRPRVAFCWAYNSGYMAACFRTMHRRNQIDLLVSTFKPDSVSDHEFTNNLMAGVPSIAFPAAAFSANSPDKIAFYDRLAAHKPEIAVICGWAFPTLTELAFDSRFEGIKLVMGMDTPYLGTLRQRLGRFARRRLFDRVDHVFVTGERCWQLARILGFPEDKITRGVYGIDFNQFAPLWDQRAALPGGWPKQFLYIGRYIDFKAIDKMLAAYAEYRAAVKDPWPLICMGHGPLAKMVEAAPGVTNLGYLHPLEQNEHILRSGVSLLASRFDPWPLVVVESCAAGLPIICTEACGSAIELVRNFHNGRIVPTDNVKAFSTAMLWMHRNHDLLPEMGRRGRDFAAAYSAERWTDRWSNVFFELLGRRPT